MGAASNWFTWALLSAVFAALTTVFAKLGVADVDADFATFLRTLVVVALLGVMVFSAGKWTNPLLLPARTTWFLALSALATGASWICYFRALKLGNAAQVAPIDKLSVVMVAIIAALFLGEKLPVVNWIGVALIGVGAVLVALQL